MKIRITADSTCDLTKEIIDEYDFSIIPVGVMYEDDFYRDGVDLTTDDLFDLVEKSKKLPRTSANNPAEYEEFFKQELEKGYDFPYTKK